MKYAIVFITALLTGCGSDSPDRSYPGDAGVTRRADNVERMRGSSGSYVFNTQHEPRIGNPPSIQDAGDRLVPRADSSVRNDAGYPDSGSDSSTRTADSGIPDSSTSGSICGDGVVSGQETCDTAIPHEEPGGCLYCPEHPDPCQYYANKPKDNASEHPPCAQRHCVAIPVVQAKDGDQCCLSGYSYGEDSDCGLDCAKTTSCTDDDGCCPSGCVGQDTDCPDPSTCNNGEIEGSETCDNGQWTTNRCPTECDDGEVLLGNPDRCSAYCATQ